MRPAGLERMPTNRAAAAAGILAAMSSLALFPGSGAAQWIEPPGQGWVDLTAYHQDTRSSYDSRGTERPFFGDGHAVSTSVFLTVAGGLLPGVDAWIQAPYQRLRYDDLIDDRLRTGIGDTRIYVRGAPLRLLGSDFPFAVRFGGKFPVEDFAVDAEVIPLGDGQRDWELIAELGHSFYPVDAYVSGWIGYRWREENSETFRDFGDEAFFLVKGGFTSGRWSLIGTVEGAESVTDTVVAGLPFPTADRSLYTVYPAVGFAAGPGAITVGARFSIAGTNLPTGTAFVAGYFVRWAL